MRFDARLRLQIAISWVVVLASGCDQLAKVVPDPPCPASCGSIGNADELVQALSRTYRDRDLALYTYLFATETDQAPFHFFLNAPVSGIDNWDLTEELRIHRRMFKPEDPLPGEIEVHQELWLISITINLSRTAAAWMERTDLTKPHQSNGLDSEGRGSTGALSSRRHPVRHPGRHRLPRRRQTKLHRDRGSGEGCRRARASLIYRWEDLDPLGSDRV